MACFNDSYKSYFVIFAIICCSSVIYNAEARRPGFQARITQVGLNYANGVALELLMNEIKDLKIPNVSEKKGPMSISLTNIQIKKFPKPTSSITTHEDIGLRWRGTSLSPQVTAQYSFTIKFGFIKIHKTGTITAKASGISFVLDIFLGRDGNGRPTITPSSCTSRQGQLQLSFSGGFDNLLNLVSGMLKKAITSVITAQICVQVRNQINQHAVPALATLPVTETVENVFDIDFRFVKYPSFAGSLQTYHKGEVYFHGNHKEAPFQPPVIPDYADLQDRMIYVFVTNYLLNSAAYAAYSNNYLGYNITQKDLPAQAKQFLRTTCPMSLCLGVVFPELDQKYPNSMAEIDLRVTSSPNVTISGDKVMLKATADAEFHVQHNHTRHSLFTLNTTAAATLQIIVNGSKVKFQMTELKPNAGVKSSNLNNVGTSFFYTTITRVLARQFIIPKVNELGNKGFDIPELKEVKFVNPTLMNKKSTPDVFVIGLDIRYNHPQG